jgi:hypothetical protein
LGRDRALVRSLYPERVFIGDPFSRIVRVSLRYAVEM